MKINKIIAEMCLVILAIIIAIGVIEAVSCFRISKICTLIESGNTEEAVEHIKKTQNINRYSAPVWTRGVLAVLFEQDVRLPLISACRMGDFDAVVALLENGADPNEYLDGNWSPIEAAIISGKESRLDIIKELVAHGADVNLFGSQKSALFEELIALMYSKELSQEERILSNKVIVFLLENDATVIEKNGTTILHYLAYVGDLEMLEKIYSEYRTLLNSQNDKGKTPLMWAVSGGKIHAVEFLISNGANINTTDKSGRTAYDHAIEDGYVDIAALLSSVHQH